jgi:hypothetical protein
MQPYIKTISDLTTLTSRAPVELECFKCQKHFFMKKNEVLNALKGNEGRRGMFCSQECRTSHYGTKVSYDCKTCNKGVVKSRDKRRKSLFCSRRCSAIWHNSHKTTGTKRSKLERWLEEKLPAAYPDLKFIFNDTSAIQAELDIYVPELSLAFELNGIFHYEPIFGLEKLNKTQTNDSRKILACAEKGIGLAVIDCTIMRYFKPDKAVVFLDIITKIINDSLLNISK